MNAGTSVAALARWRQTTTTHHIPYTINFNAFLISTVPLSVNHQQNCNTLLLFSLMNVGMSAYVGTTSSHTIYHTLWAIASGFDAL
jgi:hypothetical protein